MKLSDEGAFSIKYTSCPKLPQDYYIGTVKLTLKEVKYFEAYYN